MKLPLRSMSALISFTLWAAVSSPGQTAAPLKGATTPAGAKQSDPVKPSSAKPGMEAKSPGGQAPGTAAAAGNTEAEKPYVIGSLDILEIKVWNDAKLSGIFDVRPDGMLSLPLIGEMKADGLTVAELTQLVKTKLAASVMEDPEVNIQVARINSKKFYIFGGCLRQGEFPLVGPMTVLDAFANCGGFKDFANPKKIYILRGTQRFSFNYKEVSQGKHMEQNRRLENGDRIFVPE